MIEYNEGHQTHYIYIITNKHRNTFYIGVTSNLPRRLEEHHQNIINNANTFASKYNIEFLVYYEKFSWIQLAIAREKEIKKWNRTKKLELIKEFNDNFEFLNEKFQNKVYISANKALVIGELDRQIPVENQDRKTI